MAGSSMSLDTSQIKAIITPFIKQNGLFLLLFISGIGITALGLFQNNKPAEDIQLVKAQPAPEQNVTPKIFVDRTNHDDLKYLKSAIYTNNGSCTKAFVTITDVEYVKTVCGDNPAFASEFFNNDYLRKASYERELATTEATFLPYPFSCSDEVDSNATYSFVCIRDENEFMKKTHITTQESNRVHKVYDKSGQWMSGVWKIEKGLPVRVTVPSGYIVHHLSLDGMYVNYK